MVALVSSNHAADDALDPVEAVLARLEEPTVLDSLNLILDHLDLLAVLVEGLDGFISRSDTIVGAVADGVSELRNAERPRLDIGQMLSMAQQLADAAPAMLNLLPVLERVADSELANPALIDLASQVSRAMVRGAAESRGQSVTGLRAILHLLKDQDVGRALGFVASIARALGQELRSPGSA